MSTDFDSFALPTAIRSARLRRLPKASWIKVKNNYVAERRLSCGHNSGNRRGAGAPAGNQNALTHGASTAEMRAFQAHVWQLCRRGRLLLARRKAALAAHEAAP